MTSSSSTTSSTQLYSSSLFQPNYPCGRWWWFSNDSDYIWIDLVNNNKNNDDYEYDKGTLLQKVHNVDPDKKLKIVISIRSCREDDGMAPITAFTKVLDTIRTIENDDNSKNNNKINNHDRCLSLWCYDFREENNAVNDDDDDNDDDDSFSFQDDFHTFDFVQEHLPLMNAIGDGVFQELSISYDCDYEQRCRMRQDTAQALGRALLKNNNLKHLRLGEIDMITNGPRIQQVFFNALQKSESITDITLDNVDFEFSALYTAAMCNLSLKTIEIHNDAMILSNLKQFQEIMFHCDLNICGQRFLKSQNNSDNNNKNNNSSTLVTIPLQLWPLILARMKKAIANYQMYNEKVIPKVPCRLASATFGFLQMYLAPELAGHNFR